VYIWHEPLAVLKWCMCLQMGLFNFRPSVRPVPLEVHIHGFPGKHYCPRMATMNKPAYQGERHRYLLELVGRYLLRHFHFFHLPVCCLERFSCEPSLTSVELEKFSDQTKSQKKISYCYTGSSELLVFSAN